MLAQCLSIVSHWGIQVWLISFLKSSDFLCFSC